MNGLKTKKTNGGSMKINCPECGVEIEIDSEDIPDCACDEAECDCPECECEFKFGWYATLEVR